jgi:transposase-like protein
MWSSLQALYKALYIQLLDYTCIRNLEWWIRKLGTRTLVGARTHRIYVNVDKLVHVHKMWQNKTTKTKWLSSAEWFIDTVDSGHLNTAHADDALSRRPGKFLLSPLCN